MKKFSTKGALLFAAAMAVCAFAIPSMASAASWGVVGSSHTLDSPNIGYTATGAAGSINSSCSVSSLGTDVRSAGALTITSASFGGCTSSGPIIGHCTTTWIATKLPWVATPTSTTNITIDGVHINLTFENIPGAGASCTNGANGTKLTFTGNLRSGLWSGNGANQHEITFSSAEGLVSHSALGNNSPVTLRGTFRDTQQTLTLS
jgi:hypothetical protein